MVSIGGLSVREMMGYGLLAFLIAFPLFAMTLLIFYAAFLEQSFPKLH